MRGTFLTYQKEIVNESGHQFWHKVTVHNFGDKNIEVSVRPYETWSEMCQEDLDRPYENNPEMIEDDFPRKSERGEGDRVRSAEVAARRAKRKVRHLCKMLKARYMLTLTTREIITDTEVFQRYFQEFVRRVRLVSNFQYVATHELQKRGALHLHIAVANRQDYKLLWSIWHRVVGQGNGRVHVTSGNKKAPINRIAAYISKYIAKSFLTGELNKRRYWSSKGIGEPQKTVHLLRPDMPFVDVLKYIVDLCPQYDVKFDFSDCWQNCKKGFIWLPLTG